MWSQLLTVIGLVLEIFSVAYSGSKWWPFWKSMEEKKIKEIEEKSKSLGDRIKRREKEWFISFGLLSIGVIFQAIAALLVLEW